MWHWFENPRSEQNRLINLQPLDNNPNIFVTWLRTVNWEFPDQVFTKASSIEYIGLVEFGAYNSYDKTWNDQRQSFRYNPTLNEDNNISLSLTARTSSGYDEYQLIASGYFYLDQAGETWEIRISGLVYSPNRGILFKLRDHPVDTKRATIQGVNIYY